MINKIYKIEKDFIKFILVRNMKNFEIEKKKNKCI